MMNTRGVTLQENHRLLVLVVTKENASVNCVTHGRIKISSAVGANVAKYSAEIGENYQKQIPGRIILQESTKNSKGNIVHKYTALFLDGTKEVLDEVYLKSRMEVFAWSIEKRMKPRSFMSTPNLIIPRDFNI